MIQNILLDEIRYHYDLLIKKGEKGTLETILSKFEYQFIDIKNETEANLSDILKKFNFFTIDFYSNTFTNSNAVIVMEDLCLIIQNANIHSLSIFFNEKRKENIINLNPVIQGFGNSNINSQVIEDVSEFTHQFKIANIFIKITITPIMAYLIRRFYYPTNIYKNPSFFSYNLKNEHKSISDVVLSSPEDIYQCIKDKIEPKKDIINFAESEFIILRTIYHNDNATFHLVLHIKNLYIFMYKKIKSEGFYSSTFSKEIEFCKKNCSRYLVKFYGFVRNKNKNIIGFIYEYMTNGTLSNFIKKNKINNFFAFESIIRIFKGIKYIHSNNFVHLDIKSSNILIDHDNLCYISDFDQIKHNDSVVIMSDDIGSFLYMSPEQKVGKILNYSTDIYSFGLLIFFIFQRKEFRDIYPEDNNCILEIEKIPEVIQNLFKNCIKIDPDQRPKIEEINNILYELIKSFYFIHQYFIEEKNDMINIEEFFQFLYECFFIYFEKVQPNEFCMKIGELIYLFESIKKGEISNILLEIGLLLESKNNEEPDYLTISKYYKRSSKYNNSYAQQYLANLYFYGNGVEKSILKAKKYYELSAKQNNSEALYALGYISFNGLDGPNDYKKARKYYKLAANLNNSNAIYELGNIYFDGIGIEKNHSKALDFFEKSASLNNSNAYSRLGQIYYEGTETEKNFEKAKYYFELASNLNNTFAIFSLGKLYFKGEGVMINQKKAVELFEAAAEEGCSDAQIFLGNLYYYGIYLKKDYLKAKYFYEKSAEQNDPNGLYYLGYLYLKGTGVQKDEQKAMHYLELSAKQDNSSALNCLGYIYFKGIGVEINLSKAKQYFIESKKYNNPFALFNLGDYYIHYMNEPKDRSLSIYYYKEAAKQGISEAYYNLGNIYFEDNFKEGIQYFLKAAKLNNSNALFKLGIMCYRGIVFERDLNKAQEYFFKASKLDNPEAMFYLGLIYYEEHNYVKAKELFIISERLGNLNASFYLGLIYEKGQSVNLDLEKAISYYRNCTKSKDIKYIYNFDIGFQEQKILNFCFYRAFHRISLIYINKKNDLEYGFNFLKIPGNNEYIFAQNSMGLYYKYFSNLPDIEANANTKHYLRKASKKCFFLSEFNIAIIHEKNGEMNKSIKHYERALKYQNYPLFIHENIINDEQLEISGIFINCYSNLKLYKYYLEHSLQKNDKYLFDAFFRPALKLLFCSINQSSIVLFRFDDIKTILTDYFLQFPLFHLNDKDRINKDSKKWISSKYKSFDLYFKKVIFLNESIKKSECSINEKTKKQSKDNFDDLFEKEKIKDAIKNIFYDLKEENFIMIDDDNKNEQNDQIEIKFVSKSDIDERVLIFPISFIKIIKTIDISTVLKKMDQILFTPPYLILFGQIQSYVSFCIPDINNLFYEGFDHSREYKSI